LRGRFAPPGDGGAIVVLTDTASPTTLNIHRTKSISSPQFAPVKIVTWCDASLDTCNGLNGLQPVGSERLLAVVTEATNTEHSYGYLAQKGLSQAVETRQTMARPGVPLEELLIEAGLHPLMERGELEHGTATIKVFDWNVVPPAQANR